VRDALLGLLIAAAAAVELLLVGDRVQGSLAAHLALTPLLVVAVGTRRAAPLVSMAVAALLFVLEPLVGSAPVAIPFLTLLFLLVSWGWYASTRTGVIGVSLLLVAELVYLAAGDEAVWGDLAVNVVIVVMSWLAARLLRLSTDRRVRTEVEADRLAREALEQERSRIARELHDSLAHALTLITLRAGSARERSEPSLAREALTDIEQTGRDSLQDMHRFLGLLGPDADPAPGVAELERLVHGIERGGLDVDLDVGVHPEELSAAESAAVYRVVQEALTNVVRHSGAATASTRITRSGREVVVRVLDDGTPTTPRVPGSGRGLNGLRDRVAALGGTLECGSTPEGWLLEVRFPTAGTGS
jgi:signal transduction histidine kinase